MKQIYIVEDGRGNKKIGMTGDIKRRVTQLKTAIPNGIMSVMISDFMENAREVEKQLHEANKAYRLSGEWFSKVVDFCDIDFSYSTIDIARKSILMFQEKLQELAVDNVLTVEGWRVLVMIVGKVDFENFIHIKQVQIAQALGMKPPNVSKAFKQLTDLKIIEKITQDNINGYRLNYEMGWKGKASNLKSHIKDKTREKIVEMAKHAREAKKATDTNDAKGENPVPPAKSDEEDLPQNLA